MNPAEEKLKSVGQTKIDVEEKGIWCQTINKWRNKKENIKVRNALIMKKIIASPNNDYMYIYTKNICHTVKHCTQGAKWVYLTWDAVKGCLVSFCSVGSTSNCTTRKSYSFFPIFPFVNFVDIFRNSIFLKYYTFKQSL